MDEIIITDHVRQAHDDIIAVLSDSEEGLSVLPGAITAALDAFYTTVPNYDADQGVIDEIALTTGVLATLSDVLDFPVIAQHLSFLGVSVEIGQIGIEWQSDSIQLETLSNLGAALIGVSASTAQLLGVAATAPALLAATVFGVSYSAGNLLTRVTSLDERLTNLFFDIFEVEHR
ncbi:MAG TPA: hypothetical protein DCF45_12115, partial [Gammaproteobacteria bacterium]|nr:hypothetical protein [Gammaproteobacteria bacterium]